MAEELRWETLQSNALVDTNAFGEFRNDTSADLFIRSIDMLFTGTLITATTAVASGRMQVSKSNTIDLTNNTSIFQLNIGAVFMNNETNGVGPSGTTTVLVKLYAKSQLILEPGESLFGHVDFNNIPTNTDLVITLGYHF